MEEVRGSSPLSSTIKPLIRPPFVVVHEAFWLAGLAFAYRSAYQCVRTLIVGEEHFHRGGSAGQYRTELLAVHEFGNPGVGVADEV
jgi:hypothetical protein